MTDEIPGFSGGNDFRPLKPTRFDIDPEAIGKEFEAWVLEEVARSSPLDRPSEFKFDSKSLLLTWRRGIKDSWVERLYFTKSLPGSESPFSRLAELYLHDDPDRSQPNGFLEKYGEDPNSEDGRIMIHLPNGAYGSSIIFTREKNRIRANYFSNELSSITVMPANLAEEYMLIQTSNGESVDVLPPYYHGRNISIDTEQGGMRIKYNQDLEDGYDLFFKTDVNLEVVSRALISPKLAADPIGAPASADTWLHANLLGLFGIREELPPGFGKLR